MRARESSQELARVVGGLRFGRRGLLARHRGAGDDRRSVVECRRSARSISIRPCWRKPPARAIRPGRCAKRRRELQRKWFRAESRELVLDEAVRGAVQFDQGNLASDDPALWQPALYDVIFCRNVLMYFSPEQMRAAIARIAGSLAPGGYLFLGHAETLRGISDDFHLCHTHDTFYYQRKERLRASAGRSRLRPEQTRPPRPTPCRSGVDDGVGRYDPPGERARRGADACAKCRRGPAAQPHANALGACAGARSAAPRAFRRSARATCAAGRRKPNTIRTCCWSKPCC